MNHKSRLLSLTIFLVVGVSIPKQVYACLCGQPDPLAKNLEYNSAVFVGVLVNMPVLDSLYSSREGRQFFYQQKHFNLRVIKYHKGLGSGSDYVTVFDQNSIAGFLRTVVVGDTILVFANHHGDFLEGNMCNRWAFISTPKIKMESKFDSLYLINAEERQFTHDTSLWKAPVNKDELFLPQTPIVEVPNQVLSWEQKLLIISLLVNVGLFVFHIVSRYSARD